MFAELDKATLEALQTTSRALKGRFRVTESTRWNSSAVSAELVFQSTHLINAVVRKLRPDQAQYIGPLAGINKGVEDESADVLFNFMNLANVLGISAGESLDTIPNDEKERLLNCNDPLILCSNLMIQTGELWDAIFRGEGYKHMIREEEDNKEYIRRAFGGSLVAFFAIPNYLGVDLFESFLEMHKDASLFIENFKRE